MTSWLMKMWWGGNPDEQDPLTGLSGRDIHLIQRTWAPIYNKATVYGIELFKRLFRIDPVLKHLFVTIRNMSEEEFSKSSVFQAHTINLMTAINMLVVHLNQPDIVVAMIQKLGMSHRRNKVTSKNFEVFIRLFIDFLKTDRSLSRQEIAAWTRYNDFFYKQLIVHL